MGVVVLSPPRGEWWWRSSPRFTTRLVEAGPDRSGSVGGRTVVSLPPSAPRGWRDALTGAEVATTARGLEVANALAPFPVAVAHERLIAGPP
jgi:hypothetical protein